MIGIRTKPGPWWGRWWPNGRSPADTAPHGRARQRRLRWVLGFSVGVVAGTGIAALVATINAPTAPASAMVAAARKPPPSVEIASAAPTATAAQEGPTSSAEPAPAPIAVTPDQPPLQRDEVRELQAKLRSFGFDPGPVDGIAGRATEGAVLRYQQERGQSETGKVDRQLLEQLRHDPAPQLHQRVAQRAARPDPRPAPSSAGARSADPLQPVKDGFDQFGRWLDSVFR